MNHLFKIEFFALLKCLQQRNTACSPRFFHWHPICCKKGRICRNTPLPSLPTAQPIFRKDEFLWKKSHQLCASVCRPKTLTMAATWWTAAHMLHLFGDVATELLIKADGDEGLFCAYDNVEFLAPVYAGDYIEACGEIVSFGNTSRKMVFEARKVIVSRPGHQRFRRRCSARTHSGLPRQRHLCDPQGVQAEITPHNGGSSRDTTAAAAVFCRYRHSTQNRLT